jgi:hypothetical protein
MQMRRRTTDSASRRTRVVISVACGRRNLLAVISWQSCLFRSTCCYVSSVLIQLYIWRPHATIYYFQSTISINRCAVVKKGGKVLSYAAIVVVGNGKGLAAIGKGKDKEVGRAAPDVLLY